MTTYRKRPVVVDAWKVEDIVRDATKNWHALPPCIADDKAGIVFCPDGLYIKTLEGSMRADIGDYVIRGVKGELYPCKPDIFEATYERVEQ